MYTVLELLKTIPGSLEAQIRCPPNSRPPVTQTRHLSAHLYGGVGVNPGPVIT